MASNILITGGRGFIGVNLVQYLSNFSKIIIYDNLNRASPTGWIEGNVRMIQGDILDEEKLRDAMQGVTHVVHLAAYGSVVESVHDPTINFDVNVRGTFNVLKAASKAGVGRFVFASTGGALIGDAMPPVNEDSVPKPISPYGSSKMCGEAYCYAFAKSFGLETVCLRFGNVYGPHSAHKKGAVTTFIKSLLNKSPIVIYGDGSASRDYIYVDDLCAGIKAALDVSLHGEQVLHLASARETTVLQLAMILKAIANKPDHPIQFLPKRRGEVSRNFATYEKAKRILGFIPNWSLEDGLNSTWEWFCAQEASVLAMEGTES